MDSNDATHGKARDIVRGAIERRPATLGTVIDLPDIQVLSARGVGDTLGLTQANQRVLLHRARSRVRKALATHHTARN